MSRRDGHAYCVSARRSLHLRPDCHSVGHDERRHDLLYHGRIDTGSDDPRHVQSRDNLQQPCYGFDHDDDPGNWNAGGRHELDRVDELVHDHVTSA